MYKNLSILLSYTYNTIKNNKCSNNLMIIRWILIIIIFIVLMLSYYVFINFIFQTI